MIPFVWYSAIGNMIKERKEIIDARGWGEQRDGLQKDTRDFPEWWTCPISWLGYWVYDCVHLSKLTELYTKPVNCIEYKWFLINMPEHIIHYWHLIVYPSTHFPMHTHYRNLGFKNRLYSIRLITYLFISFPKYIKTSYIISNNLSWSFKMSLIIWINLLIT